MKIEYYRKDFYGIKHNYIANKDISATKQKQTFRNIIMKLYTEFWEVQKGYPKTPNKYPGKWRLSYPTKKHK